MNIKNSGTEMRINIFMNGEMRCVGNFMQPVFVWHKYSMQSINRFILHIIDNKIAFFS